MSPARELPPGYIVAYPNREKAASKTMKTLVVFSLLASVVLMLLVTFGGWSKLEGLQPLNFLWCIIYLAVAYLVSRWARGMLPIVSGFAILLLVVALIAGTGASGTSWFQRNHFDYAPAHSIFGGSGFSPDLIGILLLLLIPAQILVIVFSMKAFGQGWNVEVERHIGTTD
jgi:hypothetical protein